MKVRPKIVRKHWGLEIWMVNNDLYCWKIIICVHNRWSSGGAFHYHKNKDETFYIKKGRLLLDIDSTICPTKNFDAWASRYQKNASVFILDPGDKFRVIPLDRHRFRSDSPSCIFYEISTRHEDSDSYRIQKEKWSNR